jgi:hypothetical protein
MRQTFLLLSLLIIITSCKKIEGSGGTSSIRGKLSGQDYSFGEKEITTVYIIFITQTLHGFLQLILNYKEERELLSPLIIAIQILRLLNAL